MAIIGLQGIRGGVGTTSVTAALGWALQQLGESVLIVDASPDNMLRLLFNMEFKKPEGWARFMLDQQPWQQAGQRYVNRLEFLPFGQLTAQERQQYHTTEQQLLGFSEGLAALCASQRWQWILIDLPEGYSPLSQLLMAQTQHVLTLVKPDLNCHIRLHQQPLSDKAHLLVNQLRVNSQVQKDIFQLWLDSQRRMVPLAIHLDEAMAECLAVKQPLGEYRSGSLSGEEISTLASWCLLHLSGDHG